MEKKKRPQPALTAVRISQHTMGKLFEKMHANAEKEKVAMFITPKVTPPGDTLATEAKAAEELTTMFKSSGVELTPLEKTQWQWAILQAAHPVIAARIEALWDCLVIANQKGDVLDDHKNQPQRGS